MALFSKKRRQNPMARELDQPAKRDELSDPNSTDTVFGEEFYNAEPRRQAQMQPSRQAAVPPSFQQEQQPFLQRSLAPQSFSDNSYQIVLSKIDVVDAKLDALARRLEIMERLLQSLQQAPSASNDANEKAYQRRIW